MKVLDIDVKEVISNIKKRNLSPFLFPIYEVLFSLKNHSGDNVLREEWDNLIVLDACRFDYFKQVNDLDGELEMRVSLGSQTDEWLNSTFKDDEHEDIVYVTANPHVSNATVGGINSDQFYDCYLTYMRDECMDKGATRAECVNQDARKAINEYPDKKLIIHYIQPHAPYIGEKRIGEGTLYDLYSSGTSIENLKEAYKSNLEYVISNVKELLDHLDGKTVITSDHGEMIGEKGCVGHRSGVYFKELIEVPWLEVEDMSKTESR